MGSTSENTFGSTLRRAQDLSTFITGFTGYNPPRPQESAAGMSTLITSVVTINASESSQHANYKAAVDARQAAFTKKTGSVEKLLSPIKGAIEAQYGKKSTEATTINAIIKKMRATKLTKAPVDPTKTEHTNTISQSERSYGSMTQLFNNIVNSLTQFTEYNPTNNALKTAQLQFTATQLTTLNDSVVQNVQLLQTTRSDRQVFYTDLKDRAQRIKSYVKAEYGNTSNEYNLIKGITI
jgi:hypothetical protein